MINNTISNMDCNAVDSSVRLGDLRQWKPACAGPLQFYLDAGDNGGVIFSGNPELVRKLLRIYNAQKLFLDIKFVCFLNSEGIAARRVSAPMGDILGYRTIVSNN
ncbi:MAG TPA: hypothetical protein VK448_01505 [Dissulfurispiraceae bacterium]|nr:hypothetical protein [Dissulfurispiraceae bacterium]